MDLLRQRNEERAKGILVAPCDRRVTIDHLLDDLVAHFEMRKLASTGAVQGHRKALLALDPNDRPGKDGLSGIAAAKLTTARVTRLVTVWQKQGIKNATVNKRLGTLRHAYSLALKSTPPKVALIPTLPRLEECNAREGFFEKGEFYALLAHLPDDGLRDFVEWAYWTGMRKGEVSKLTWAAFDRQTWTLVLPARSAKTRKPRKLVLTGPLRAIIERRLAARRLDTPLIFWRLHHGKPGAVYEFRKSWDSACEAAGLTPGVGGCVFHDLRRTGVRNLIRAGVGRKVAMKISGHLTESIFERYNIDTDDDLRDAIGKVSAYVESLPGAPTVRPLTAGAAS